MRSEPNRLRAWAAAGLWACVVWSLGDDGFSATQTSRLLGPLVAFLLPDLAPQDSARVLFALRKAAHVVEYALLALLTLRALRLSAALGALASVAATLALVGALACADELRQGTSAARTGSAADVALDMAGALFGIALLRALPAALRQRYFPTRDPAR